MSTLLTSTFTCPSNLSISPRIAEIKEDFPHPTVPTTATKLPFGIAKLILENKFQSMAIDFMGDQRMNRQRMVCGKELKNIKNHFCYFRLYLGHLFCSDKFSGLLSLLSLHVLNIIVHTSFLFRGQIFFVYSSYKEMYFCVLLVISLCGLIHFAFNRFHVFINK